MRMFGGERVSRARDEVLLLAKTDSSSGWVDDQEPRVANHCCNLRGTPK